VSECVFGTDWKCNIEGEEIPLEVCQTCIEAKSTASREKVKKKSEEDSRDE